MEYIKTNDSILLYLWNFLKKYKISLFTAIFISSLSMLFPVIGGQYLIKILIDKLVNNELTFKAGIFYFIIIGFTNFSMSFFNMFIRKFQFNVITGVQTNIRNNIFQYTIKHSLEFFNNNFAGTISNKINDLAKGSEIIIMCVMDLTFYIITFCVMLYIFARESLLLFFISLVWLVIYGSIFPFLSKKLKKACKEESSYLSKFTGLITDDLSSISIIKSFSKEKYEKVEFKKHCIQAVKNKSSVYSAKVAIDFLNFISYSLITIIVGITSFKLFLDGKMTLGTLNMLIMLVLRIFSSLRSAFDNVALSFEQIGNMQQALDTLTQPLKIVNL